MANGSSRSSEHGKKRLNRSGYGVTVLAIDLLNQNVKWTYGTGALITNISVDCNGNIYFEYDDHVNSITSITALSPNGQLRWKTPLSFYKNSFENSIAIDKTGNVLFATDTLYSINYEGSLNWKKALPGQTGAPVIVDGLNKIYVASEVFIGPWNYDITVSCYTEDGEILWTKTINSKSALSGSPVITYGNKMILPFAENRIIIIE